VRVLTLNRPAARNGLSQELVRSLYTALRAADADDTVGAVVLTGADPAFCAGVDLKEAARDGLKYFEEFKARSCITAAAEMRAPTIGAINGATFTGGLELALACDFLVASERAVFADTHARVGILPSGGMTARLPRLVGAAMARRLSMTGEVVDAVRAERIGLVTEVVQHDRLLKRSVELAGQIAEVPKPTMLGLKEIYTSGSAAVLDPALAEDAVAGAQNHDHVGLGERFVAVSARNKQQPATSSKSTAESTPDPIRPIVTRCVDVPVFPRGTPCGEVRAADPIAMGNKGGYACVFLYSY
jgi:enoyl-CoA hydratase